MRRKLFLIMIALGFVSKPKAFAQEWEFSQEYAYSGQECVNDFSAVELCDGRLAVSSSLFFKSGFGDFYSYHPALRMLSSDGTMIAENQYFKEGYWCSSENPFVFEKDDALYALMAYSPDHDPTYFNYFKNYDNPPTEAIIGLYKLDDELFIQESYEHSFAIDTFEKHNSYFYLNPNEFCGHIFVFTAFADGDAISGAYIKSVSADQSNPRGHDSLFFFKMDFDGSFVVRKGYQMTAQGQGNPYLVYRPNQMLKTDSGYLFYAGGNGGLSEPYLAGNKSRTGTVFYLDHGFNIVKFREIKHYDQSANPTNSFYNYILKRSLHNSTYMSTATFDANFVEHCRLYEFDDDKDGVGNVVPILHYIERKSSVNDRGATCQAVDLLDDNSIFYAYTLNHHNINSEQELDSWMMIEHLYNDFDTISTVFYDLGGGDGIHSELKGITATKDGGVVIVFLSKNLLDDDQRWTTITKFPAEALVGIDEAHASGLKVAIAYPNPGKETLNIRTGLKDARVEVYDMSGRMVYGQEITEDVTPIDAEEWPAGAYVWRVIANGREAESGKWVKE